MSELNEVEVRINNFRVNLLKLGLKEYQIANYSGVYRTSVVNFMDGGGITLESALKISNACGVEI